jgi:hypothetical protein
MQKPGLPDGVIAFQKSKCLAFLKTLEWKIPVYSKALWFI